MAAKKKIAFVIPSLEAGGGEKSLVNLLSVFDFSRFDVDLYVLHQSGMFMKMVPSEVNIVAMNDNFRLFSMPLSDSVLSFIAKGRFDLAIHRFLFFSKSRSIKNKAVAEQKAWKHLRNAVALPKIKYDAAIGYLEKSSVYFAVDCLEADKKIGWIHTRYSTSGMDAEFDRNYFAKLSQIVTVSPECVADLQINFPEAKSKISIIHNILSPDSIRQLAKMPVDDGSFSENTLITVARLSAEKGIDIAIEAAKLLKDAGVSFQWLVIGDGSERESLQQKIASLGLANHFRLLGVRENPYAYVWRSAIYVQPSRYEGKSISIDEAKILGKPIIVTDFETAPDQITSGQNGLISSMKPEILARDIAALLADVGLQRQFSLHLSKEELGTESEADKLYRII